MRKAILRFNLRKERTTRKIKTRAKKKPILYVFRSNRYIYAQIVDHEGNVIVCASSLECSKDNKHKSYRNISHATEVGEKIAERASKKGLKAIVFNNRGYKYHGVVKKVADGARTHLNF